MCQLYNSILPAPVLGVKFSWRAKKSIRSNWKKWKMRQLKTKNLSVSIECWLGSSRWDFVQVTSTGQIQQESKKESTLWMNEPVSLNQMRARVGLRCRRTHVTLIPTDGLSFVESAARWRSDQSKVWSCWNIDDFNTPMLTWSHSDTPTNLRTRRLHSQCSNDSVAGILIHLIEVTLSAKA